MPIAPGAVAPLHDSSRPTLYAFFKHNCPTCQVAFPVIGELERRYGDAVEVVAVAQDAPEIARPWLDDKGFAGRAVDDSSGYTMSLAYEIDSVPTLVLVNDDGTVVSTSESWDRDRYNQWAHDLGERTGRTTDPVSTEADGRPAFKPG